MKLNPATLPLARLLAYVTPFAAWLASPAAAEQITVDLRGTGDTLTIQAAVDLAQDGDVVLVFPGSFTESVLVERGIWIVAQQPDTVFIEGTLMIQGLAREQQAVLVDLNLDLGTQPSGLGAVHVVDCEGPVMMRQCRLTGGVKQFVNVGGAAGFLGGAGLLLERAQRVSVMACEIRTPSPPMDPFGCCSVPAANALEMVDSRAGVWGSTFVGGDGVDSGTFGIPPPTEGASGAVLEGSELFLSGSSLTGGDGGDNDDFLPFAGTDGGDAVRGDAGSQLHLVDNVLFPGIGGEPGSGGVPGNPGSMFGGNGSARFLGGASQNHEADRWAFASGAVSLTARGNPGARARLILVAGQAPFIFDAFPLQGSPFMGQDFALSSVVGALGTIPAGGEFTTSIPIPALPSSPGLATGTFFVTVGPAGRALFGAPMPFVALNCATLSPDCDGSGVSDLCEIVQGVRPDANQDGLVDGCGPDCNLNGVVDSDDIASGFSADLNGNLRPDECEPLVATWYVSPGAAPGGNGSAAAPFATLGEAREVVLPQHEIVLLDGVHTGPGNRDIDFPFGGVTVRSANGPLVCAIDLEGAGRALDVNTNGEFEVRGLTFRNGNIAGFKGGAIRSRNADIVISECIFEDSSASGGGGVSVFRGTADVRRSRFLRNVGQGGNLVDSGGGLYLEQLAPGGAIVDECLFMGNRSPADGGGLHVIQSTGEVFISRSRFLGNGQLGLSGFGEAGGAISIRRFAQVHIDGCLFAGNFGGRGGAIWGAMTGSLEITSCTFAENFAAEGNAIEIRTSTTDTAGLRLSNCVLKDPAGAVGNTIQVDGTAATIEVNSATLEGGASSILLSGGATALGLNGLVNADPLFANPLGPDGLAQTLGDNDYSLGAGSPSIDAGDNARITADRADVNGNGDFSEPVPLDITGHPRRVDDPAVPDSGLGTAPIVDHGAFEWQ